jgi:hypothetical protein
MSEMPANVQQAIDIVEDECFLNDFSPVEKTKSRKILWRVGNIIRDRIKASAAARCSADSAQPVAWRWRSIFNDSSWCYGPVMPTAHDQYVTEPLYVRTEPQSSSMASDDPTASKEWNDGCDFAMTQLCKFLDVEPSSVSWDAATETVEGDVSAVIGNILRAKFGEDWGPQCQAVSAQHRYDQDGQTCPTCGRVGNSEG